MNEILETKAKELTSKGKKYFNQFDLFMYSCKALSSIGFINTNFYDRDCNQNTNNELFNLFIYLYYHDNEKLNKALANKRNNNTKNVDVYKDTLKVINILLSDITQIDDIMYDNIIIICNTVTKVLYKSTYEEFLVNYIKE